MSDEHLRAPDPATATDGERPMDRAHARAREAMTALHTPEARRPGLRGLRRRPRLQSILLVLIGAVTGAVGVLTWEVEPSAQVVVGTVGVVDPTASAIVLSEPAALADRGLGIVGVLWREGDEDWRRRIAEDGSPTCVGPSDVGQRVRLGLVTDPGGPGRPASEVVAWLECLPG